MMLYEGLIFSGMMRPGKEEAKAIIPSPPRQV